jgi:hypothetical protein
MNTKFANLPEDEDTLILHERLVHVGGLDAWYQMWVWDSIVAESLIFTAADAAHLPKESGLVLTYPCIPIQDRVYGKASSYLVPFAGSRQYLVSMAHLLPKRIDTYLGLRYS